MSAAGGKEQPMSARNPGGEPRASGERGERSDAATGQAPKGDETPVVLVVEDEEPIAAAVVLIVEDAGYTAIAAAHGKEALALSRTRRPALVITDLMMPYLDGRELIAAIRDEAQQGSYAPPPIVLMTAAGPRRAQEAGADALLRKPFNIEDVEALLRRFLGTARRQTDSGELPL